MPRTLLATLLALLALPAAAHAASIGVSGGVLTYTAAPGEENRPVFSVGNGFECMSRAAPCFIVDELFGPDIASFPAASCSRVSGKTVECAVPASVIANLGDRDDSLRDWNGPSVIDGGAGNEHLGINGNGGNDVIRGGPGNDALFGEDGNDRLEGGDGDDSLEGFGADGGGNTTGTDVYVGGPGRDLVDYSGRTERLTVTLDGVANDGAAGEGDNVGADVERVDGGVAGDTLTGNAAANELVGWGGDDLLRGGPGDDLVRGGPGSDRLLGDAGADRLEGDDGADELDGGSGVDRFYGDTLMLWTGSDRILARDGAAEVVTCGAGDDTAVLDASDEATAFGDDVCERVDRPAGGDGAGAGGGEGGGGAAGGGAGGGAVDVVAPRLTRLKARAVRRGRIAVRYRLSEPAAVRLRLQRRVRGRYKTLRRSVRDAGAAGANRVRVRRRLRKGRYRLVAVARDPAGNRSAARRTRVRR